MSSARSVRKVPLKESEWKSSGGIAPSWILLKGKHRSFVRGRFREGVSSAGFGRSKFEKEHLVIFEKIQRRRIDGQDSQGRLAKSRQPSDLGEVAQDLSLSVQGRSQSSSGLDSSENRSLQGHRILIGRNRDPRFPERTIAVDPGLDTCQ
jgi:hypothetical protein